MPLSVSIASWIADGVIYVASGRTVSDHALSLVTQKDCQVLRALREGNLAQLCVGDQSRSPIAVAEAAGNELEQLALAPAEELGAIETAAMYVIATVDLAEAAVAVDTTHRLVPPPARRPVFVAFAGRRPVPLPARRVQYERPPIQLAEAPLPRTRPQIVLR